MGGGEILRFQWAERAIAAVHVESMYAVRLYGFPLPQAANS
jgi:hypothetical protein